jgi:hypothetical protein
MMLFLVPGVEASTQSPKAATVLRPLKKHLQATAAEFMEPDRHDVDLFHPCPNGCVPVHHISSPCRALSLPNVDGHHVDRVIAAASPILWGYA